MPQNAISQSKPILPFWHIAFGACDQMPRGLPLSPKRAVTKRSRPRSKLNATTK